MMLEALVALAQRRGLLSDRSFAERWVNYQLRIMGDGRPTSLIPLGDEGRGKRIFAPVLPVRSGTGVAPAFLVDNAQYVLGFAKRPKGGQPQPHAVDRASNCRAMFSCAVTVAAEVTGDDGLLATKRFLARLAENPSEEMQEVLALDAHHEWTGDEVLAFALDADANSFVHERSAVRAYWSNLHRAGEAEGSVRRCLVTGTIGPIARVHDKIKGIPAAQRAGAALVSFNERAFDTHGFEQGDNAPISPLAMSGYTRALNDLLRREGTRRFRSGIPLGDDSVVVFWTREDNETADVLLSLLSPSSGDDEQLRAMFEAAWKGLAPRDVDTTPFYALTLGGNAARVVVRDWLETTAAEVKDNVRRYFADLGLDGDDSPLSIARLLRSLQANPAASGDKRALPPALSARLVNAALRGVPFPRELLHAGLARLRVPPRDGEWRGTLRARVALIKATLLRLRPGKEISMSLDEASSSVPYLLGRLFAAMERLQGVALGDVNATLRDRYFGSASATPALVFPRLLRVSAHHASKAESGGRGWAERVKAEIIERLPAKSFPRTLNLEDQGLFAVGYYHQRQAFFTPRNTADAGPRP